MVNEKSIEVALRFLLSNSMRFNVYKGSNAYVTFSWVVFFYFDDFNLTIISIHFFQTVSAVYKDLFD